MKSCLSFWLQLKAGIESFHCLQAHLRHVPTS